MLLWNTQHLDSCKSLHTLNCDIGCKEELRLSLCNKTKLSKRGWSPGKSPQKVAAQEAMGEKATKATTRPRNKLPCSRCACSGNGEGRHRVNWSGCECLLLTQLFFQYGGTWVCNCVGGRTGQKGELKGDRGEAWGKGGKPLRGRRWQDLDAASNKHRRPARKPIISLKAEQHRSSWGIGEEERERWSGRAREPLATTWPMWWHQTHKRRLQGGLSLFQKKNRFNSKSYSTLLSTNATYVQSQPQGDNKADGAMAFQPLSDFSSDFKYKHQHFYILKERSHSEADGEGSGESGAQVMFTSSGDVWDQWGCFWCLAWTGAPHHVGNV